MKKTLLLATLLIVSSITAKAQNLIAVQHAGTPTFYQKLPDAVAAAMQGDTLYIPGGSWDAVTINKSLHLFGVGHDPDSTTYTSRTVVQSITLNGGADNGSITGIYTSAILLQANLTGIILSRCNVGTFEENGSSFISTNFTYEENIIGQFVADDCTNASFYNNIVLGTFRTPNHSIIKNNIFLSAQSVPSFVNSTLENNIFSNQVSTISTGASQNCVFNNNVNDGVNGLGGNNNQGNNNFLSSTPQSSIFTSYDPTISGDGIYKAKFALPAGSPYKNAGKDGTDIGIYGGAFPWKPGSVPFNPHIQSLTIAPKTDASGNLKVQIAVAAQSN